LSLTLKKVMIIRNRTTKLLSSVVGGLLES